MPKQSSQNVDALDALLLAHRRLISDYRTTASFIGPRADGQPGQMEYLQSIADKLEDLLP